MLSLGFDRGTLLVQGTDELPPCLDGLGLHPDGRTGGFRGLARAYRPVVEALHRSRESYADAAPRWEKGAFQPRLEREPWAHQAEALRAFEACGRRGLVVLPTGSGKTQVALMVMARLRVSTLVVVPTLDLMRQWYGQLRVHFDAPIGLLGGGSHEIEEISVATYDSAWLHVERWGDRFGLLVFDECHHLPGPSFGLAAEMALAPYRLGLSATIDETGEARARLEELIGPEAFRAEIGELKGGVLADFHTERLRVALTDEERETYEAERALYRGFVRERGIRFSEPGGWSRFLAATSRSERGRRALQAWRAQREIAHAASAKLEAVERLLLRHRGQRTLVFTHDNATAYRLARRLLVPVITHRTKVKERQAILDGFRAGSLPVLVTSRVLNEGVDVPDAAVGIVVSGTSSAREHVQRLGRILRRAERKRAVLYELLSESTAEEGASERRRQHEAWGPREPDAPGGEA